MNTRTMPWAVEKQCPQCRGWWPADGEFYVMARGKCSPEQKRVLAELKKWRADIRYMMAIRRAAKTAARRAEARA